MGEGHAANKRLYIVTGMSGAGKSTALRVFEDLRYFAVDGLPLALAPEVAAFMDRAQMSHYPGMAISMDPRQDNFASQLRECLAMLKKNYPTLRIIFLDADDRAIMRRYASTRRPHPMEINGLTLEGAIAEERASLSPLKDMADLVIDSTDFSIHDLRRAILRHVRVESGHARAMRVVIISFGFKHGLPNDSDFVFDLRFLDNPHFVDELRPLSGKDKAVSDYVLNDPQTPELRQKIMDLLLFCLERMEAEGRYRVTIAFGCTGGRHRSVAIAEDVAQSLRQADYPVAVEHRHLNADPAREKAMIAGEKK